MKRPVFRKGGSVLLAVLAVASSADAKDFGVKTPSGRRLYRPHQRFSDVLDHRQRILVSEVAVGAGPEGNIAALLGFLNFPIRRLDLFGGFGIEGNPATLWTFTGRYTLPFSFGRTYVGAGYLFKNTYAVGVHSHNVFAELGYTWEIHRTFRLSLGLGVRRILTTRLNEDSTLKGPELDPNDVQAELDRVFPWLPTAALRLSRAF